MESIPNNAALMASMQEREASSILREQRVDRSSGETPLASVVNLVRGGHLPGELLSRITEIGPIPEAIQKTEA